MGRCVLRFWYFLPCRSKILSDILGLRRLNLEHWLPPSECQEGFMRNAPLSNVKCYSLPSDTKPDLLRHKVVAFGNWRCHIHGRPGAAGARGDGVWHFATSYLLHHQLSPNHQQQGLCAGAKPVWCRQSPPANKSWHLELVRREGAGQGLSNFQIGISLHSRGSCRWEDETEECGPRAGPDAWWLEAAWQCHQWRHLAAARVSHDVAPQRFSAPSQQAPSSGPRPLHRRASNRRAGSHT